MQISIMEISMSLNGNLGLSWGITQPTEKDIIMFHVILLKDARNRVVDYKNLVVQIFTTVDVSTELSQNYTHSHH